MSKPSVARIRGAFLLASWRALFRVGHALMPARTARYACDLFRTPRPRAERAHPDVAHATRETVRVDGACIALYRWGDPSLQPYVLFAHGWGGSGAAIAPWVASLRAMGVAVVAFDQPAHGLSDGTRADLPRFIRTLGAIGERHGPAAAVIGHSLGCAAVAVAMASRALVADRAVLIAASADLAAATRRFTTLMRMPPTMVEAMFDRFERDGIHFDALRADAVVPAIDRPALVVHDLDDREVPWAEGAHLARHWPGARLLTTQGLGHARILADPAVIEAGLRFLRDEAVGEWPAMRASEGEPVAA